MKTAPDIRGSELIHPDHLQRFNDLIRTAYEDGKSSVGFEMKVIRRDGKVRWLLTQCSFVKTVEDVYKRQDRLCFRLRRFV